MENQKRDSLNNYNREELASLIVRARTGSQEAFSELKKMYLPLIESKVSKYSFSDMSNQDIEDIRQEALICFCNAICSYDCTSESVEFGLYAKICIENGLVTFIRSYSRRNRKKIVSLDSTVDGYLENNYENDLLQLLIEKEKIDDLAREIKNNLSEYENHIWWMYVSGMSVAEITKNIGGTNAKSVSNAIYRIRKKLRAYLTDRSSSE